MLTTHLRSSSRPMARLVPAGTLSIVDYRGGATHDEKAPMNSRSPSPSSDAATDVAAFKLGTPPGVPKEVQASFLLWLTAIAAGALETIIRVIDALPMDSASGSGGEADLTGAISGVVIRVIVYALVVYITTRMRLGKSWARLTLAVLLGVIGTLSLVIDPISWLAAGNSPREVFTEADLLFFLIAPIRAVHLAAVIAALVLMFLPAANTYFRAARSARRRALG
jgi:hypothetical protein